MKKIKIYRDSELLIPIETADYEINVYVNSFEVVCHDEIDRTYSIPYNKNYKIEIEI